MPRSIAGAVLGILLLLVPPVAAVATPIVGPLPVIAGLLVCLVARATFREALPPSMVACLFVVAISVVAVGVFDPELATMLYPVFMNATMLVVFALTLWRPPTMIERFARLMEPDLDAHGVSYTRRLTWVWVGFFLVNGCIALWTVSQGSWLVWGIYNGGIAYVLAGSLLGGEYLVRRIVRERSRAA